MLFQYLCLYRTNVTPPPRPPQLTIQMYSNFLYYIYACIFTDLFTNVDMIIFGNKLFDPVYFNCVIKYMNRYMF